MLPEVAAPPVRLPRPPVKPLTLPRRLSWLLVTGTIALAIAATYVFRALHVARDLHIEIEVVSRVPFHEETPRVAYLLVSRPDGGRDQIEARRYGSAFLDQRTIFFFDVANRDASQFLFSPPPGDPLVAIRGITARSGNAKEVTRIPLEAVEPVEHVEIVDRRPDRLLLKTSEGENKPLVRFALAGAPQSASQEGLAQLYFGAALLFLGAWVVSFFLVTAWPRLRAVSLMTALPFIAVAALILIMALLSRFNAHPDEYLHFETARYFMGHLIPPALDDSAAAPTFSHYGFSYLQDLDTSYFLMGRFMAVVASFCPPEIAARLFNVLLFIVVAIYALIRLRGSLAAAVLLISPQVWYVFSYANGDAWAFAVALLVVVQLATEDSYLNDYLRADNWRRSAGGAVAFAVLLVLLLMAKRNYYLFFPFIALVAAWKSLFWDRGVPKGRLVMKWAAIVVMALALYLPARVAHLAINRFELPRLQSAQAEKFAAPGFRPSDFASGKGYPRMALKKQGVGFADLFTKYRWARSSFESFSGVYHWMSLKSPGFYYVFMGGLYAALLVAIGLAFRNLPITDVAFAGAVFCAAITVVLLSAYSSWTADFQPQGRYLFPVLPMLGFILYRYRESLRSRALHLLFVGLLAASVISFVFTGLREIPQ